MFCFRKQSDRVDSCFRRIGDYYHENGEWIHCLVLIAYAGVTAETMATDMFDQLHDLNFDVSVVQASVY